VFRLAGQLAALPLENLERITAMAELASPPGLPHLLEGILNLAGSAAPVLRLDRLLDLPEQPPGLYSMLIVLKGAAYDRVAILVDRVIEIVPSRERVPAGEQGRFVQWVRRCGSDCAWRSRPRAVSGAHPAREGTPSPCRISNDGTTPPSGLEPPATVSSTQPSPDALVDDPLYSRLKERLVESTGLTYYTDKDVDLARRIARRLSIIGAPDCAGYLDILRDPLRGPSELDALIAEVTIGETYFFRHEEHFDALRNLVLPDLIA